MAPHTQKIQKTILHIDPLHKGLASIPLAPPEESRRNREKQLVDQALFEKLAKEGGPSLDEDGLQPFSMKHAQERMAAEGRYEHGDSRAAREAYPHSFFALWRRDDQ